MLGPQQPDLDPHVGPGPQWYATSQTPPILAPQTCRSPEATCRLATAAAKVWGVKTRKTHERFRFWSRSDQGLGPQASINFGPMCFLNEEAAWDVWNFAEQGPTPNSGRNLTSLTVDSVKADLRPRPQNQ